MPTLEELNIYAFRKLGNFRNEKLKYKLFDCISYVEDKFSEQLILAKVTNFVWYKQT